MAVSDDLLATTEFTLKELRLLRGTIVRATERRILFEDDANLLLDKINLAEDRAKIRRAHGTH